MCRWEWVDSSSAFEDLLPRAKAGDRSAIGHIWRTHQPRLLGWLKAVAPDVAEDLASETWFEVVRAFSRFKGNEADFRSWLFATARRRLIDHRRRAARRPDPLTAVMPEVVDYSNPEDAALNALGSEQAVQMILSVLPPDQAEVVLLRVLGGLDAAHAAEVLGKQAGAVRVLQHRGLRKLAEVLQADGEKEKLREDVTN